MSAPNKTKHEVEGVPIDDFNRQLVAGRDRLADIISAALPGLRVLEFFVSSCGYGRCAMGDNEWQYYAGEVHAHLRVSGSAEDLVRHGFLTKEIIAGLPPCGVAQREGRTIQTTKRGFRVQIDHDDPLLLKLMLAPIWTIIARRAPR